MLLFDNDSISREQDTSFQTSCFIKNIPKSEHRIFHAYLVGKVEQEISLFVVGKRNKEKKCV